MSAVDVIDAAINKVRQHAWPQTMDLEEARAAVAELIEAANSEAIGDIRSAMTKAHEVLSGIAANGRKYGPIYSHANTASWQLSNAIKRLDRIDAALANIGAAP